MRELGTDAVAAADTSGYDCATPKMAKGVGGDHAGGPNVDANSPMKKIWK